MKVGEEGIQEMGVDKFDSGSQGAQIDDRLLGSSSLSFGLHRLHLDERLELWLACVLVGRGGCLGLGLADSCRGRWSLDYLRFVGCLRLLGDWRS